MIYHFKNIPELNKMCTGKTVVFVSGCFDILHEGHLEFLEKASEFGDILVVGVLSDAYIRNQKHREPVHSQKHRARLIQGFKPVAHVILTPLVKAEYPSLPVLKSLRPDIFFRQEKVHSYLPIKKQLSEIGIDLRSIFMKKVHSTTQSIQDILSFRE